MIRSLAPWAFGFVVLALIVWRAIHKRRVMVRQTLARRTNPTKEQFLLGMKPDVSPATAEFLWVTILPYIAPTLAPHPDDHLWADLPIDEDDVTMDWPRDFAESHDRNISTWPDWPTDLPVTVRNFGHWLDSGLA